MRTNLVTKKIILSDLEVFGENYGYGVHKKFYGRDAPVQKMDCRGYADANVERWLFPVSTRKLVIYYGWAVVVEGFQTFLN